MPIPPEAKRIMGLTGTVGGSDATAYVSAQLDADDPDSDIPDE
jgi:serine/arginine repetitive matrix protein 2